MGQVSAGFSEVFFVYLLDNWVLWDFLNVIDLSSSYIAAAPLTFISICLCVYYRLAAACDTAAGACHDFDKFILRLAGRIFSKIAGVPKPFTSQLEYFCPRFQPLLLLFLLCRGRRNNQWLPNPCPSKCRQRYEGRLPLHRRWRQILRRHRLSPGTSNWLSSRLTKSCPIALSFWQARGLL